jgi:hypothetical protein
MITAAFARERLSYDPVTGAFKHLMGGLAGQNAGSPNNRGYIHIMLSGKLYKAHRLAWLMMMGDWPQGDIDHINMDRGDNRWINLRDVSRSQNRANTPAPANNSSGYKGVHWKTLNRKWCAQIKVRGKKIYLGLFDNPEDAHARYAAAVKEHFGDCGRSA